MKKIIHIDMDCFFAAVEMREQPQYRDVPIAIGGSSDRRGVIATCNYPAREFGVRSAMATARALKLCPQLVLLRGRMDLYAEVGYQIRDIFRRYTDKIEPLSLDEAYLDVSDSDLFKGSATLIAEDIRRVIKAETGLTASAGIAPCKFVAKVASDENKPDGICVITPDTLDDFVAKMPLGKVPGVGKVTQEKLQQLGLVYCRDVRNFPQEQLLQRFGKFGQVIWQRSHGIDERDVSNSRVRKSVGVEHTLAKDIHTEQQCREAVEQLYPKLHQRLEKVSKGLHIHHQGIKLKFDDFQQTTVEQRNGLLHKPLFYQLLQQGLQRQQGRGIRLVGLQVGLPDGQSQRQLNLPLEG